MDLTHTIAGAVQGPSTRSRPRRVEGGQPGLCQRPFRSHAARHNRQTIIQFTTYVEQMRKKKKMMVSFVGTDTTNAQQNSPVQKAPRKPLKPEKSDQEERPRRKPATQRPEHTAGRNPSQLLQHLPEPARELPLPHDNRLDHTPPSVAPESRLAPRFPDPLHPWIPMTKNPLELS